MRTGLLPPWFIGHVASGVGHADGGTGAEFGEDVVQPTFAVFGQQFPDGAVLGSPDPPAEFPAPTG